MGPMISSFLFPSQEVSPSEVLFTNDKLQKIALDFQLTEKELIAFHKTFRKMDIQGTGYINLDSLYAFIGEELSSSISPYMERFFMLIEKENLDKITFIEWLPSTCVYCLYTEEKILKFVFNMIDHDQDNFISKKDMMKHLSVERFGKKIFPYNYVKSVETLEVVRGDKISINDFKKLHLSVPFMCFPAFYLQQCFRASIIGETFWKKLFEKILMIERDVSRKKQFQKVSDDKEKSKQQKIEKKTNKFDEMMKERETNNMLFKGDRSTRKRGKRASDSVIEIQPYSIIPPAPIKRNSLVYIKSEFKVEKEVKMVVPSTRLNTKLTQQISKKGTRLSPHRQGTNLMTHTESYSTQQFDDEPQISSHHKLSFRSKKKVSQYSQFPNIQDGARMSSPTKKSRVDTIFSFD